MLKSESPQEYGGGLTVQVVEGQGARCSRGEHEAEFEMATFASSNEPESQLAEHVADAILVQFLNLEDDSRPVVKVCRHCRCLYVAR